MRTLLLCLLLAPAVAHAQSPLPPPPPEDEAIREHVVQLFDAMRAGNASGVRAHFHDVATLYSVGQNTEGETVVRATNVDRFAEAIGGNHPVFDEHVGPIEIRRDGDFATAYMPYAFYLGDEFSHCGVNAFHIVRTVEGWRTLHVTDTRRRTDCDPSIAPE